jgi:hypothetical protein
MLDSHITSPSHAACNAKQCGCKIYFALNSNQRYPNASNANANANLVQTMLHENQLLTLPALLHSTPCSHPQYTEQ